MSHWIIICLNTKGTQTLKVSIYIYKMSMVYILCIYYIYYIIYTIYTIYPYIDRYIDR